MKHVLIAALVLSGVVACAANSNAGVHVLHARSDGTQCNFSDDTSYKTRGLLDVSSGNNYFQAFGWENTLDTTTLTTGGQVLQDPSWHEFIAKQAQYAFTSNNPAVIGPFATTEDLSGSIAAGATSSQNDIGLEMFPSSFLSTLATKVPVGKVDDTLTVDVSFRIAGEVGGMSTTTNWFTFPVTIVNSGYSATAPCPAGTFGAGSLPLVPCPNLGVGRDFIVCSLLPDGGY